MVLPLESVWVSSSGLLLESNWEFQLVLPSRSELRWASLLPSVSPKHSPLELALARAASPLQLASARAASLLQSE